MSVTTVNVKPKASADDGSDSDDDAKISKKTKGVFDFSRIAPFRIQSFELGNRAYKTHSLCCYGAAFSNDGVYIAACGQDKTVTIHEAIGKLKLVRRLIGHHSPVLRLVWANDGEKLLSAATGELIIWDALNGEVSQFLGMVHSDMVTAIDWARWGHLPKTEQVFLSASYDKTIKIWAFSRKGGMERVAERQVINCSERVMSAALHPTLEQLVMGCDDGSICLYGIQEGAGPEPIRKFRGHADAVLCLTWQRSIPADAEFNIPPIHADMFASASHDKTVKLWYRDTERAHRTLNGHTNVVLWVAFGLESNPSSKRFRVFTVGHDACVGIWEGRSGKLLNMMSHKETHHNSWITSVDIHPTNGRHMVTTSIQERYSLVRWDPLPPLPTVRETVKGAAKNVVYLIKPAIAPVAVGIDFLYHKVLRKVLPIDKVAGFYRFLRHSAFGRVIRNVEDLLDLIQWHVTLKVIEARLAWGPYQWWWRKCYLEWLDILETGEIKPRLRKQWQRRRRRYRIKLIMALYPYKALQLAAKSRAFLLWAEKTSRPHRRTAIQMLQKLVDKYAPAFCKNITPKLKLRARESKEQVSRVWNRVFRRSSKVTDIGPATAAREQYLVVQDIDSIDKILVIFMHFDKATTDEYLDHTELNALLTLMQTFDPDSPSPLDEETFRELIADFNPPEERASKGLSLEGVKNLFDYAEEEVVEKVFKHIESGRDEEMQQDEPEVDDVSITPLHDNDDDESPSVVPTRTSSASTADVLALRRRMAQTQTRLNEAMQRHEIAEIRNLTVERNSIRLEIAAAAGQNVTKPQSNSHGYGTGLVKRVTTPAERSHERNGTASGSWLLDKPQEPTSAPPDRGPHS